MDVVGAPNLPGLAPYGLLRSARIVVDGSDKETTPDGRVVPWIQGFEFRPEDCEGGSMIHPCTFGSSGDDGDDPTGDKGDVRTYMPLQAEAAVVCSTFGSLMDEERARGRRKLLANAGKLLEAELWTGAAATALGGDFLDNPKLADAAATSLGTLGYEVALGELEQALADALSTQDRMIHAQPRVVSAWTGNGLVEKVGDLLRTKLGTIVVPGAGYPGTGPAAQGADEDNSYAYATSMVEVRLGEITTTTGTDISLVDRAQNTVLARFQRFVAATWDGCALTVANVKLDSARAMS